MILGVQPTIGYVPDFYYAISLCSQIFVASKVDPSLSRIETVDMHSLELNTTYASIYVYLKTLAESNPPTRDLMQAISLNGILSAALSAWIYGKGTHTSPEIKRHFRSVLPGVIENGGYSDSYFLSPEICHMLPPNLRLMYIAALICLTTPIGFRPLAVTAQILFCNSFEIDVD